MYKGRRSEHKSIAAAFGGVWQSFYGLIRGVDENLATMSSENFMDDTPAVCHIRGTGYAAFWLQKADSDIIYKCLSNEEMK